MDEKDDEIWCRITLKGKVALLLIDIKDFFHRRFSRTKDVMSDTEKQLCKEIGEDALKEIGEQIAEVIRQHDLQLRPDVCRKLFNYLSDVIDGWNCV